MFKRKTPPMPTTKPANSIVNEAIEQLEERRDYHFQEMEYYQELIADAQERLANHTAIFNAVQTAIEPLVNPIDIGNVLDVFEETETGKSAVAGSVEIGARGNDEDADSRALIDRRTERTFK